MSNGIISRKNNTFTAFRYSLAAIIPSARRFFVAGYHVRDFPTGASIRISNSSANDGTYTVTSSVFDASTNRTRINVLEPVANSVADGFLDLLNRSIPWNTGDTVVLATTKFLPAPFLSNRVYYVIKKSNTRFSLADTPNDAITNVAIEFTSGTDGVLSVAEIVSSFKVFGGAGNSAETWFHYALDKNDVRTINTPDTIMGMQTLINIVDGYSQFQRDTGVIQNITDGEFDPVTGRFIDWNLETERFIDWAYSLRNSRLRISDSYPVIASPSTGVLTFTGTIPSWVSGTAVSLTTSGTMPSPLLAGEKYYAIQTTTAGQIKLSTSPNASDTSSYLSFTTPGSGVLMIGVYDKKRVFPSFELNPSRNNLWVDTPEGVLANVIDGPYSDIRVQQTIFDQYNRILGPDKLAVYRQDERTKLSVAPNIANDVDPAYGNDPYNFIHIAGAHFFVEGYEHFLLLNDATVDGSLIYDQFFGLSTNKFDVDYLEKRDYTLRPTLGGYFLVDNTFLRNIEGATSDIQQMYDVMALSEGSKIAQHSRALVGYEGRVNFLDLLNVNSKSQFLFHRGMIQSKGSMNSVNAYINSRRFVDAKIDEFWAWKLAEFGDARPRTYPEVNLFMADMTDDLRFEFLGPTETTTGSDAIVAEYAESRAKLFNLVSFKDQVRWVDYPEQKEEITSSLFLDGEASSMTVLYSSETQPPAGQEQTIKYWYKPSTNALKAFDTDLKTWTIDVSTKVAVQGTSVYLHLDEICDNVRVVRRSIIGSDFSNYTTTQFQPGAGAQQFVRVNAELLRFNAADFTGLFIIFAINPAFQKINPMQLIDTQSNTVVQQISSWHPALGEHYENSIAQLNLIRSGDPAQYTITLESSANNPQNGWNEAEAGRTWWDTNTVGWMPYYDDQIYPSVNNRISSWGALAPWASVDVYKWVQSTIAPSDWDAAVAKQALDTTVPQSQKLTGTPKQTLFKRVRTSYTFTVQGGRIVAGSAGLSEGQFVIFYTDSAGTLPIGIAPATKYIVTNLTSGTTFDITDIETQQLVSITATTSASPVYVVPEFTINDWKRQPLVHDRVLAPASVNYSNVITSTGGTITYPYQLQPTATPVVAWVPLDITAWDSVPTAISPDTVDVYVNGVLIESNLTVHRSNASLYVNLSKSLQVYEHDVIDIVRPYHTLTKNEAAFDPDVYDDGSTNIQWKQSYEYTVNTLTAGSSSAGLVSQTYYYFWVKGITTKDSTELLSLQQVGDYLGNNPQPFFIVQKPKDDPMQLAMYQTTDYISAPYDPVPVFYRQVVVRNIVDLINDENRYTLRFTRNWSLRDNMQRYGRNVNIKDKHEKWVLFRRDQSSSIDYQLWTKMTDALVGYSVTSAGDHIRVPSLDRELYDALYNTSTRIGLGVDQAFTDASLSLPTVLKYLNDPNIDFGTVNLNEFFATYSFDTPENIRIALTAIYDTFGAQHVNNIWFEVLQDSLSLRPKYKELMKTSWLALHGVRVLEVGGLFDD